MTMRLLTVLACVLRIAAQIAPALAAAGDLSDSGTLFDFSAVPVRSFSLAL